jgi:hypothetical protein
MYSIQIPAPGAVTPQTPLRLEIAARLAFPDNSMSAAALRRMISAGKLNAERIAGRYYTTLADIEDMREKCRVKAKDHASPSMAEANGSSGTDRQTVALDAMNSIALALKESLQNTSLKSTTRQGPSKKIIPMRPK